MTAGFQIDLVPESRKRKNAEFEETKQGWRAAA